MLSNIYVQNLALIRSLSLDLEKGFSVLTGGTGAGKSLVLSALGLFLEQKGAKEKIRHGQEEMQVDLFFDCLSPEAKAALSEEFSQEELEEGITLSRRVNREGKNLCKLGGKTVPFARLSAAAAHLLSMQGQFSAGGLLDEKNHRKSLDAALSPEGKEALSQYESVYLEYAAEKRKLEEYQSMESEEATLDLIAYQMGEIAKVKPKIGEEEALEKKLAQLQNGEKIYAALSTADRALNGGEKGRGAHFLLEAAARKLETLGEEDPSFSFSGELYELARRAKEIAGDVAARLSDLSDEDPADLSDRIRKRLDAYYKLKLKYGATTEEILAKYESLKEKKDLTLSRKDDIKRTKENLSRLEKALEEAAENLQRKREERAAKLEEEIHSTLSFLDMPKTRFSVEFAPCPYGREGNRKIRFLLAANEGEGLRPLAEVASGGELSRVMLALQLKLSGGLSADTLVFDEVDTGISGATAQKIGIALKKLSLARQVLCVTHSAQVATLADHHFLVQKDEEGGRTETSVALIESDAVTRENARLFAGATLTDEALEAAKNLRFEGEKEYEKWKDTVL